ncbi:hypothetical protein Acsp03_59950 [Actinomadura sp. NBRC 104412]|nr:hypothetical protein Acsp03_59950 [Actinomadura sp. NBRC 104412]
MSSVPSGMPGSFQPRRTGTLSGSTTMKPRAAPVSAIRPYTACVNAVERSPWKSRISGAGARPSSFGRLSRYERPPNAYRPDARGGVARRQPALGDGRWPVDVGAALSALAGCLSCPLEQAEPTSKSVAAATAASAVR